MKRLVSVVVLVMMSASLWAQDLEPRRWTHLPVDMNIFSIGYARQDADIYFNPMIGITDGTADINAWLARFSRSFNWFGMTARIDGILPYVSGTWWGLVDSEPGQRSIRTGDDPWLRLSLNFVGSPAMRRQEYLNFLQKNPVRTIVGASLAVSLPWGGYEPKELINVGSNRFALRPQIGVLHERGSWSYELTSSVSVFSANDDFVESIRLSQEPIFALQAHVTRNFKGNFWLGAGIAYAAGGEVKLDGAPTAYEVDNVLWNLVGSYRITNNQSVMLAWHKGRTQVDVGTDTDSWLLSYSVYWGG